MEKGEDDYGTRYLVKEKWAIQLVAEKYGLFIFSSLSIFPATMTIQNEENMLLQEKFEEQWDKKCKQAHILSHMVLFFPTCHCKEKNYQVGTGM